MELWKDAAKNWYTRCYHTTTAMESIVKQTQYAPHTVDKHIEKRTASETAHKQLAARNHSVWAGDSFRSASFACNWQAGFSDGTACRMQCICSLYVEFHGALSNSSQIVCLIDEAIWLPETRRHTLATCTVVHTRVSQKLTKSEFARLLVRYQRSSTDLQKHSIHMYIHTICMCVDMGKHDNTINYSKCCNILWDMDILLWKYFRINIF